MRWFRKREEDLDRELRNHLDLEAEEQGDRDAARRTLGNVTRIKESVREAWGWSRIERIAQDLRYVFRQIRRTPGFTAIATLTLAVGLGATTAIFSIVNGVLLQPLKYRDPERLFLARTLAAPDSKLRGDFPNNAKQFEIWQKYCRACDGMALFRFLEVTLAGAGEPVRLPGLSISHDFFKTLGVYAAIGRDFGPNEPGGSIILTDAVWRSRFAADPAVIGRGVQIAGESHVIVGVMPPDLHLPKADQWGSFIGSPETPMIFRPVETYAALNTPRPVGNLNFGALIRLKPGITREQGIAELNALLGDVYRQYKVETRVTLLPLQQQITRDTRGPLWLLLGTVGIVLLIVCVNVGNLMLVRTAGRYREAGVRLALGAGRGRLFAVVFEEALVLVTIGGALGIALAASAIHAFARIAPLELPRVDEIAVDWRVLAFAFCASAISAILCGIVPAWRLSRIEPLNSLKAAAGTESGKKLRLREVMVGAEVALSTLLLIVGALLLVSFYHVLGVDTGIDVAHVVTQDISFLNPKYAHGYRREFMGMILPKLAAIPGAEAIGAVNQLPIIGEDWVDDLEDPDQPPRAADQSALVNNRFVTPGYFKAMGIPLIQGRYLDESDRNQTHAVISERAARFLWGKENPIGRHVVGSGSPAPHLEVVGVVGEVRGAGLDQAPTMMIYEHYWREQPIGMSFVVRTHGDGGAIASAMRSIFSHADPEMAIPPAVTMQQIVDASVEARRFEMTLVGAFSITALLLACLGIYGVISFAVARRTPEIGIRVALGARGGELVAMILKQGMMPVMGGLAVGLIASLAGGRVIAGQLYGVTACDPWTISAVVIVLLIVAAGACLIPARRATKIDPLVALRFE